MKNISSLLSIFCLFAFAQDVDTLAQGFIGVYLTSAERDTGAEVLEVIPDSPAQEAGLKKGDIIIEFQGKRVINEESILEEIEKSHPGDKVSLVVKRRGRLKRFNIIMAERPKEISEKTPPGILKEFFNLFVKREYLGIKTVAIVPGLDEYFDVKEGILIVEVLEASPAQEAGLRPGDVIIGIDDKVIKNQTMLNSYLRRRKEGEKVTLKIIRHKKEEKVIVTLRSFG